METKRPGKAYFGTIHNSSEKMPAVRIGNFTILVPETLQRLQIGFKIIGLYQGIAIINQGYAVKGIHSGHKFFATLVCG